jgi:hypothetical protein
MNEKQQYPDWWQLPSADSGRQSGEQRGAENMKQFRQRLCSEGITQDELEQIAHLTVSTGISIQELTEICLNHEIEWDGDRYTMADIKVTIALPCQTGRTLRHRAREQELSPTELAQQFIEVGLGQSETVTT